MKGQRRSDKAAKASAAWQEKVFAKLQTAKSQPDSIFLRALARYIERRDKDVVITTRQQLAVFEKALAEQLRHNAELQRELDALADPLYVNARRLRRAEQKLCAIIGATLWPDGPGKSGPEALDRTRFSFLSQNEEDGYIIGLLKRCGALTRTFVEFGSGRSGGNSGMLALEARWRGLMVEANPTAAEAARERFGRTGLVTILSTFVTPENADQLILDHGLGPEVDLLSLDIDSFEYWVLEGIERCRPRLLVVEYNARFGPSRRVTVPKDPARPVNPKRGYHGASLAALAALAAKKDFRLVTCDHSGINAFFLRNDLASDIPEQTPDAVFRRPEQQKQKDMGERFIQKLLEQGFDLVEV